MPTATTPARLALCSPMAETGPEARLLAQHGFALKVVGAGAADITLPRPGGSLAFVLHRDLCLKVCLPRPSPCRLPLR